MGKLAFDILLFFILIPHVFANQLPTGLDCSNRLLFKVTFQSECISVRYIPKQEPLKKKKKVYFKKTSETTEEDF